MPKIGKQDCRDAELKTNNLTKMYTIPIISTYVTKLIVSYMDVTLYVHSVSQLSSYQKNAEMELVLGYLILKYPFYPFLANFCIAILLPCAFLFYVIVYFLYKITTALIFNYSTSVAQTCMLSSSYVEELNNAINIQLEKRPRTYVQFSKKCFFHHIQLHHMFCLHTALQNKWQYQICNIPYTLTNYAK